MKSMDGGAGAEVLTGAGDRVRGRAVSRGDSLLRSISKGGGVGVGVG